MVFPCGECDKVFPKQWELQRHVNRMHNDIFSCDVCKFETNDKRKMSIHKKQHVQEYFNCGQCRKTIKGKGNFQVHVREQHGAKRFSCHQCSFKTDRAHRLSEHKKTHIKKIKQVPQSVPLAVPQAEPFVVPPLPIAPPQPQLDKPNKSAFGGKMQERAWNIRNHTDPLGAFNYIKIESSMHSFFPLDKMVHKNFT